MALVPITADIKPNCNYLRDLIRDYGGKGWSVAEEIGDNVKLNAPPYRGDKSKPGAHLITWVFLNKCDVTINYSPQTI